MRRFYTLAGISSIPDEELELIEEQAAEGDPVACYKQAQIYRYFHECDDYVSSAHKLLIKASEGGIADADAAIAMMMFTGEIEPYNPLEAVKVLEKAINNGSVSGVAFQLRNLLYGRYGYRQNIDLVKQTVDVLLSQGEDPYWCAFKGDILVYEGKSAESVEWYEKAVAGGENSVYSDLALARGINDDGSYKDYQACFDTLIEGNETCDPMCMYYFALLKLFEYDDLDPEDIEGREEFRELIISGLEANLEFHHPMSFEFLGDIYREGKMDVPVDLLKAWSYYLRGSEHMHVGCFEKMYEMLEADEISLANMSNEEAMDLCMINGARLHSSKLLIATVEAYKHGRLTCFAREIEMFHTPAYEALPDEDFEDEDEELDDDGRFDAWA